MKNILKLTIIGLMAFGINACDPNEDIYDELPNNDSTIIANLNKLPVMDNYTLTDDDYALSSNESVANYKNFSASDPASEYLPEVINSLFLQELGAETNITYNYYERFRLRDTLAVDNTTASSMEELNTYLTTNYPDALRTNFVALTYNWGSESKTNAFFCMGTKWIIAYKLQDADYTGLALDSLFFTNKNIAIERIPIYLNTLNIDEVAYMYANEGDEAFIVYSLKEGDADATFEVLRLKKTSSEWVVLGSTIEKSSSLSCGNNGWSFVPPIDFIETTKDHNREYTLTDADYELVGNGQYHNFDDPTTVVSKISTILKANFEDIEYGDVFLVNYDFYSGGAQELSIKLEAVEKN